MTRVTLRRPLVLGDTACRLGALQTLYAKTSNENASTTLPRARREAPWRRSETAEMCRKTVRQDASQGCTEVQSEGTFAETL